MWKVADVLSMVLWKVGFGLFTEDGNLMAISRLSPIHPIVTDRFSYFW